MRVMKRLRLAVALCIATVVLAGAAYAQSDDACIAASEKALTLRSAGRLLDARKELSTCASSSCPDVVKASCQVRLGEVGQALPSIVFDIKDGAGRDLADVRLTVDGTPYVDKLIGAVTLDPGDHEFKFEVAAQAPVVKHFVLRESVKNRREAIVTGGAPTPAQPPQPLVTSGPTTTDTGTNLPPDKPAGSWSGQKTIGLVVGGAGVAGVALGGVFGAIASSDWNSSQGECPMAGCFPQHAQAVADHDSAKSAALVSTIGFVAGGVALAAGAVLFLTAPSGSASSSTVGVAVAPTVGPSSGGILVKGCF